jgi:hypothetical protein
MVELDKSDPMRTHVSDAIGYLIAREFAMRPVRGEVGGPAIVCLVVCFPAGCFLRFCCPTSPGPSGGAEVVAVGTAIADRPPAQIRASAFTHTALTVDVWRRSVAGGTDAVPVGKEPCD